MDVCNEVTFKDDVSNKPAAAARIPEPVTLVKVVSYPYEDVGGAEDALVGISSLTGYVFGYVDEKERRTVSFHVDTSPNDALPPRSGMTRVQTRQPMSW
jgi:hypothetical protein